jgi:hypothetical protein
VHATEQRLSAPILSPSPIRQTLPSFQFPKKKNQKSKSNFRLPPIILKKKKKKKNNHTPDKQKETNSQPVLRVFNLKTKCLQNPAPLDHGRRTYLIIIIIIIIIGLVKYFFIKSKPDCSTTTIM